MRYVPAPWEAFILALAAWRVFQLLAFDEILDQPRRWLTKLGKEWEKEGDVVPKEYREKWGLFLTCPYCAGFWIGVVWWGAWLVFGDWALVAATPWVISAGVIAGHKLLSSE